MLLHYLYLTFRIFIIKVRISDSGFRHGFDIIVLFPEYGNFY